MSFVTEFVIVRHSRTLISDPSVGEVDLSQVEVRFNNKEGDIKQVAREFFSGLGNFEVFSALFLTVQDALERSSVSKGLSVQLQSTAQETAEVFAERVRQFIRTKQRQEYTFRREDALQGIMLKMNGSSEEKK